MCASGRRAFSCIWRQTLSLADCCSIVLPSAEVRSRKTFSPPCSSTSVAKWRRISARSPQHSAYSPFRSSERRDSVAWYSLVWCLTVKTNTSTPTSR